VKSKRIICQIASFRFDPSINNHERTRRPCTKSYLRSIATACIEVSRDPSPKMLRTIRGIFQLAPGTIDELERDQIKT
jgi:hypothetical protein